MNDVGRPDAGVGPVVLTAVGDLMLGDSAICTGFGFASRYSNPAVTGSIRRLKSMFGRADLVFGNLECVLSSHRHVQADWSSAQMRGHRFYARMLADMGFTVMSVANNHTFQHGESAFLDTVALLRDAGVQCCGLRGTDGWTSQPVSVLEKGVTIGFLAYCLRPRQYSSQTPPYAEGDSKEISRDIARLRGHVDHVVVSLHWGEEYVDQPSESEVRLGRGLIDAGASVLLGHHPHVPRPVEQWGGGIIAYSLGNFISDMVWYTPLREAAVVSMELGSTPRNVSIQRYAISKSYLPESRSAIRTPGVERLAGGIPDARYREAVARTVREQQLASYRHALMNATRFRSPTLRQLVTHTFRNKVEALTTRLGLPSRERQ